MKAGDKLYCIKNKSNIFKTFHIHDNFTNGCTYQIYNTTIGSIDGSGLPILVLHIIDDMNRIIFINDKNNLSEILYTEKEYRKMKLNKINGI